MTAGGIVVDDLSADIGTFSLGNIDLAVGHAETLVLLGPNGAGKSLTLETIAGFHRARAGRIAINGREVTRLPPERRNVALVLQNFGLFPHLSVARNIALALRRHGKGSVQERVRELLGAFGITQLAARDPQSLSPGEKQRAALARALAAEPELFLFDEPFSALDAETHGRLRNELRGFLAERGIPAIFVTHDRTDALAFGGALAVMSRGRIVQSGVAREVFRAPRDRFVAEFLGVENILPARVNGQSGALATVAVAGRTLQTAVSEATHARTANVLVAIRAEDIDLRPPGSAMGRASNHLSARILDTVEEGVLTRIRLDCGVTLQARTMTRQFRAMNLAPGAVASVEIAPEGIHLLPQGPGD